MTEKNINWEKMINDLPIGISLQDTHGNVIYANERALKMSHAKKVKDVVYPLVTKRKVEVRDEKGRIVGKEEFPSEKAIRSGSPHRAILEHYFPDEKRTRWTLVKSYPIKNKNSAKYIVNCFIDVTKLKGSERAAKVLVNITKSMSETFDFKQRLQVLAENSIPDLADWCAIDLYEENNIKRIAVASADKDKILPTRDLSREYFSAMQKNKMILKRLINGETFLVSDTRSVVQKIRNYFLIRFFRKLGLRSIIISPIRLGNKTIGFINIAYSDSGRMYANEDIKYVKELSGHTAILLENARLFEQTRRRLNIEREVRRQLKEYQETLKLAQVAGRMGFWEWNMLTGHFGMSENLGNLHGVKAGEFAGTLSSFLRLIAPQDRSKFENNIKMSLRDHAKFDIEYRTNIGKNNRWIFCKAILIKAEGKAERMIGVGIDITDQKRSQRKLFENERKFKAVYEHAADAIIILDKKGQIFDANPFTYTLFNIKNKDLRNKNIRTLIKTKFKDSGELEIIVKNSEVKYLEYSFSKDFLPGLDLLILWDMSERKLEERRREHFLGIAGHELKNPLAAVKAYLHILKNISPDKYKSDYRKYLVKIDDKSDLLINLINQLMDVTRIRHGKLDLNYEIVDFDKFIKGIIKDFSLIYKDYTFRVQGSTGKDVIIDKVRITQVVTNLLKNAVKYSPGKSKVVVELSASNRNVTMVVRDFGIGIRKKDLKRIFELYYRAPKKTEIAEGLGIGLYISLQIVRAHGGSIKVKSRENKGSSFILSLPLKPRQK